MKLKEVEMHYVRSETMWRVRLRPHVLGSVYLQQDDVQPAGLEPRPSAREENVLRVSTPTNRSSHEKSSSEAIPETWCIIRAVISFSKNRTDFEPTRIFITMIRKQHPDG